MKKWVHISQLEILVIEGQKMNQFSICLMEKEIVAKTNERTEKNVPDTEKYVFKHIDITLPYDEVKTMYGYSESGEKIEFLKDGKFILKGTEKLNDGMKGEE